MITLDAELTLSRSLDSIIDEVDEVIIVDLGSTDKTVEIASNYTPHVFHFSSQHDDEAPYRYAFEQATVPYVLWMEQGQVYTNKYIKNLWSLKFMLEEDQDMMAMIDDTFLFRRAAGFQMPASPKEERTH
ncbi:glycosyltransferase [Paenibacillus sp. D2_2]|uniref:glycosyltransferase n=1 Tax=Paenibacillus sp. D2_2 TaxID=3073092 RepID=UPI0028150888|nr:glycosyltransferase [Paenibacillus sp. D2_2]WMT43323.1 glycosyltransferase [Paenibacillus sp. D2_2]